MLHAKYQGSRPSSFRVELWNFRSLFLCSTYDPPGQGQFWPQGHFMDKLGRGPQEDATYQISNLYAIQYQRRKILNMGFFVPMLHLVTPVVGPVLTPEASYEQTWLRSSRRCYIPNIKALGLPVSEKKNFEIFFLCSYVPPCDPQGGASFDPRGIIWTNLVKVLKEMLYTKYKSFKLSSFRKKEFWNFLSLFLCSSLWPPGQAQFWPQGHHMNKLGRGPLGDATYQISKLCTI